jgi:Uma2 family endonuclease
MPAISVGHAGQNRHREGPLSRYDHCGPRRGENLVAPEPRAVFEVLSEETQRRDRTIKLADYNATPSIAHYVLIDQGEPLMHVYSRGPHGDFNLRPHEVRGLDGVVELPAISISLAMSEIYAGIELDVASATVPNW